jgi:hypothetical protein
LRFLYPHGLRVLDLACCDWYNGEMPRKAGAREAGGVGLDPRAAAEARVLLAVKPGPPEG